MEAVAQVAAETEGAEVPSEPVPDECASLSESEYLDAYMDGIQEANRKAREALGG